MKDPRADDPYRYSPSDDPSAASQEQSFGQLVMPYVRGVVGGAAGGALGWIICLTLIRWAVLSTMLPGLLMGIGCGWLSGTRSHVLGALSGVGSLAVSIVVTWQIAPFVADDSLLFFVTHLHKVQPMMLLMIVLSGACGYWFGLGRPTYFRRIENPVGKQGTPKP